MLFENFWKKKPVIEEVANESEENQYSKTKEEMEQSAEIYKEQQKAESVEEPIKYENGIDWQNPEEMLDKKSDGYGVETMATGEATAAAKNEKSGNI